MPSHNKKSRSKVQRRSRNKKSRGSRSRGSRSACNSSGKKLKLLSIKRSPKKEKKYVATFCKNGHIKQTHFGARGMQNYGGVGSERHLSLERKKAYISRHKNRENWRDPTSAGALSRWVLWNKPSLSASIADYKRKFNL